jgi:hypothetical protein
MYSGKGSHVAMCGIHVGIQVDIYLEVYSTCFDVDKTTRRSEEYSITTHF